MRGFGFFLCVAGVVAITAALMMDTSVVTLGGGRVNNIGLMADRQLYTLLGGIVLVAGILMVLFTGKNLTGVADAEPENDSRS